MVQYGLTQQSSGHVFALIVVSFSGRKTSSFCAAVRHHSPRRYSILWL